MKIEFDRIEPVCNQNFKGGEGVFVTRAYDDGMNRIISAVLKPGSSVGTHTHETSSETMIFTSGVGRIVCDGEEETIVPGTVHYCPKGSTHTIINTGSEDLLMYCVVPQQ